jgi:hypothetical protein
MNAQTPMEISPVVSVHRLTAPIDPDGGEVHTQSSTLYRARRIPGHRTQIHASLLVILHLRKRYGERVGHHWNRISSALQHLEQDISSRCGAGRIARDVLSD